MRKSLIWIGALLLAPVIYNLDALAGQWKFISMCRKEGGPKFYAPVEKDVGWVVERHENDAYKGPFSFGNVAFVRFEDKHGKRFDVSTDGWIGANERRYIFSSVNEAQPVRYTYSYVSARLPDDPRFSKTQIEVIDRRKEQVVARYTEFGYSWTKPERVLLSGPTAAHCWDLQTDIDSFRKRIYDYGNKK